MLYGGLIFPSNPLFLYLLFHLLFPIMLHIFKSCPSLKPNQTKYNYSSAFYPVSFLSKLFKRIVSVSPHSHFPLSPQTISNCSLPRSLDNLLLAKSNGLLTPTHPLTLKLNITSSGKPSSTPYISTSDIGDR